jgi:hypothetical protein
MLFRVLTHQWLSSPSFFLAVFTITSQLSVCRSQTLMEITSPESTNESSEVSTFPWKHDVVYLKFWLLFFISSEEMFPLITYKSFSPIATPPMKSACLSMWQETWHDFSGFPLSCCHLNIYSLCNCDNMNLMEGDHPSTFLSQNMEIIWKLLVPNLATRNSA